MFLAFRLAEEYPGLAALWIKALACAWVHPTSPAGSGKKLAQEQRLPFLPAGSSGWQLERVSGKAWGMAGEKKPVKSCSGSESELVLV